MAIPGATALARLVATVGGDKVLAAGLVAGLVAGGAGAFVLTGAGAAGAGGNPGTGIVACPDDQLALLRIGNGQKMLVTGRTADGAWYRVYLGSPGRPAGWVRAGEVTLQGAGDGLPVVDCDPDAGTANAPVEPVESLTAIVAPTQPTEGSPSPTVTEGPTLEPTVVPATVGPTVGPTGTPRATRTPKPPPAATARPRRTATPTKRPTKTATPTVKPTKTPTPPTAPPDTTRPTISDLSQTVTLIHYCNSVGADDPQQIRFLAYGVRDEAGGSGIGAVQLWLIRAGEDFDRGPYPMSQGPISSRYGVTIKAYDIPGGDYQWYVVAYDKAGNWRVRDTSSDGPTEFSNTQSCKPN